MNNFHLKTIQNLRIETTELVTTKSISLNKKFSCRWPVGKNRTYYVRHGKSNSTNAQGALTLSLILEEPTLPVANLDGQRSFQQHHSAVYHLKPGRLDSANCLLRGYPH